jgi:plasmid stability protein
VERITIEIPDDTAAQLREAAEAHGRTVEEEVGGLVERTYVKRTEDDWVHELIAMSRPGVELTWPNRMPWERRLPFGFDDFR